VLFFFRAHIFDGFEIPHWLCLLDLLRLRNELLTSCSIQLALRLNLLVFLELISQFLVLIFTRHHTSQEVEFIFEKFRLSVFWLARFFPFLKKRLQDFFNEVLVIQLVDKEFRLDILSLSVFIAAVEKVDGMLQPEDGFLSWADIFILAVVVSNEQLSHKVECFYPSALALNVLKYMAQQYLLVVMLLLRRSFFLVKMRIYKCMHAFRPNINRMRIVVLVWSVLSKSRMDLLFNQISLCLSCRL